MSPVSLRNSIQGVIKEALKAHDDVRAGTLRFLFASIINKEKEKRYKISKEKPNLSQEQLAKQSELQDQEVLDVIVSEAKKHRESIEAFEKGGRKDLVGKEQKELAILQGYLPEQLSEKEMRVLVQEAITATSATSTQDIGKVMAVLMPKVKGRADGALVNKIVKELLTS